MAVSLIALALVPTLEALQGGIQGGAVHQQHATRHYHLAAKVEEVLAQPFNALDTEAQAAGSPTVATAYSDGAGAADRRLVYLARYDGDDADGDGDSFTGGDQGLLWVKVEIEGEGAGFETLTTL